MMIMQEHWAIEANKQLQHDGPAFPMASLVTSKI
jgi:hypothetical protein